MPIKVRMANAVHIGNKTVGLSNINV